MARQKTFTVGGEEADFATIGDAIAKAPKGATLQLAPGEYAGDIELTQEVNLIGQGELGEVVLTGAIHVDSGQAVIEKLMFSGPFRMSIGRSRMKNCALKGGMTVDGGAPIIESCSFEGASIVYSGPAKGRLKGCVLQGTDLTLKGKCSPRIAENAITGAKILFAEDASGSLDTCTITGVAEGPAITVSERSEPRIKGCRIHDNNAEGVWVCGEATPTISDCELNNNVGVGLALQGGRVTLRRCHSHHNKANGVSFFGAQGTMNNCEVAHNAAPGLVIQGASAPQVKSCHFHHNAGPGVLVVDRAAPVLEICRLHDHDEPDVVVKGRNTAPVLKRCRLSGGSSNGVAFCDRAGGEVEKCDFQDHGKPEIAVWGGAHPIIRGCKIHKSRHMGVWIFEAGEPILEDCQILNNARVGVGVRGASPTLKACKIADGETNGLTIYDGAEPTVIDCEIARNSAPDIVIWGMADPKLSNCHIHSGKTYALWVRQDGRGQLDGCEIDHAVIAGLQVDGGAPKITNSRFHNLPIAARFSAGGGTITDTVFEENKETLVLLEGASPQLSNLQGVEISG
ncbi:MAG: right-handed parallel beta-helix repeat-containing protein [Myxococcota bacterium]